MTDARGQWGPLAEPYHADKELPPDAPPWRDNAFFAFWDRDRGVYGTSHFTGSLNADGLWARLTVVADGRTFEILEPMAQGQFGTDGVQVDLAGRIRARSDDLEADLRFTAHRVAADYSPGGVVPGLSREEPLQHFQQCGTLGGSLTAGGRTYELDGGCFRDRTWGYREERKSWPEHYAYIISFDDFDITGLKFRGGRADGFLLGGRSEKIVGSRVRRDKWGSICAIDVDLDDGSAFPITFSRNEARIFCPLGEPVGAPALTVYEEFVVATTPDGDTGFGIVEQGILRELE